jgi:hypothetical protein
VYFDEFIEYCFSFWGAGGGGGRGITGTGRGCGRGYGIAAWVRLWHHGPRGCAMTGCSEEKKYFHSRRFDRRFDLWFAVFQLRRRNMVHRISEIDPDLFRRFDLESGSDSAVYYKAIQGSNLRWKHRLAEMF